MSPVYLLAASFLTPDPVLPPDRVKLKLKEKTYSSSLKTETAPTSVPKISPSLELPTLEFSERTSFATEPASVVQSHPPTVRIAKDSKSEARLLPKLPPEAALNRTFFDPNSSAIAFDRPTSGSQLFQQRIAALKIGRVYTRLSGNSLKSSWSKAATKPSAEQWRQLLEWEAKAIASGQGTNRLNVLVGDSLTLWFPPEGLPSDSLWLNQGMSGENTNLILKRLSALASTKPSNIYVMAGINDLKQGASDREILNNLTLIVRRLHQNHPQAQVVMQSILPTRRAEMSNERIRHLNEQILAMAQREGAGYLDLYSLFSDTDGNLREDFTTDGIHLTALGYQVWQSEIQMASELNQQYASGF